MKKLIFLATFSLLLLTNTIFLATECFNPNADTILAAQDKLPQVIVQFENSSVYTFSSDEAKSQFYAQLREQGAAEVMKKEIIAIAKLIILKKAYERKAAQENISQEEKEKYQQQIQKIKKIVENLPQENLYKALIAIKLFPRDINT